MKTEMEKKMSTDNHSRNSRGSERDHNRIKVKKEDAKANGIQRQLSDEGIQ